MESLNPKTVLIVEDNELNMKLFNDLVETRGHRIVQTRSGIEAVDLARKHRPDLILMDIQLPEVSGLEVTQWLKDDEDLREIPVIAITAFAMKGDEEKILQGGCEAYLSKPISVARFFETIDRFLVRAGSRRAVATRAMGTWRRSAQPTPSVVLMDANFASASSRSRGCGTTGAAIAALARRSDGRRVRARRTQPRAPR